MASFVHLIRHGEVENPEHVVYGRLAGFGLSSRGREQASEAARYLGRRPLVAVWSSPMERALETAAAIAGAHSLPVLVDEELTEWKLADGWEGLPWESLPVERPGELEAYLEHPWDLPFSSESLEACADRMAAVVRRVEASYPHGEVAIIGHQDPIQAVRLLLTGRTLLEQHQAKPGHATVITLEPGVPYREVARHDPESGETAQALEERQVGLEGERG